MFPIKIAALRAVFFCPFGHDFSGGFGAGFPAWKGFGVPDRPRPAGSGPLWENRHTVFVEQIQIM